MARIDAFFRLMNAQGASDLHLAAGNQPCLRIRGDLERVNYGLLENDELEELLFEIAPADKRRHFEETGDLDFAYDLPGVGRFRANYFRQANGVGAVFRQIPTEILTVEQLGLPTVVKRFAMMEKGLVLVTGPTGSGKSTTLASIVDYANRRRRDHIVTIEDPIEFQHRSRGCIINHRELHRDTESFSAALRSALREDPDIILVGELRDLESISLAIEAASTGHLVLATLHTQSAAKTVERMIEVYPPEKQEAVRSLLADTLRGIMSQNLLKRVDGKGRIAAIEILVGTPAVRSLIREDKTYQLPTLMQTGRKYGMVYLDDALEDLLRRNLVPPLEAFEFANEKERFATYLHNIPEEYQELLDHLAANKGGSGGGGVRAGAGRGA
ncbi:MAG: type IV pilus twitching motility protein PilT [Planctomycetota bacterium]|jgi:twitching motility protein PilT